MKTQTMLVMAGVGLLLLTASAIQARNAAPQAIAAAPVALVREVAAEGRVATYPGAEVNVSAERGGRLTTLRIQEGQQVRRGDVLAELDAAELRAQLAESRAKARQADAELRLAESTLARRRQLVTEQIVAAQDLD